MKKRSLRKVEPYAWIAPSVILMAVFILIPIYTVFKMSFSKVTRAGLVKDFIGFENFRKVLSGAAFNMVLKNTIVWTICVVLISTILGFVLALILNNEFKGRKIARAIVVFPWATTLVIQACAWKFIIDTDHGALNTLLMRLGIIQQAINWTPTAAMIMDRGPYVVTSILSETPFSKDETLKGTYIDLFDDKLPVLTDPTLKVGSVGLWYNVDKIDRTVPADHICAAARIEKWHATARSVSFTAIGPEGCTCTARIAVRRAPLTVTAAVKDEETPISFEYDEKSKTVLLTFMNDPAGVAVKMKFIK